MRTKPLLACMALVGFCLATSSSADSRITERTGPSVDFSHGPLKVSDNRRFLVHADGTPFFYLGDTAWELFHRLTRDEAERYLENRRQKGFTVIQAVVLAEFDGLNIPNALGERPLVDNDPQRPNEKYFEHVDWIVRKAEEKGLYIGMLPTWGDKVFTEKWGIGPVVFKDPAVARGYGRFIGERYRRAPNIIWINGGDRRGDTYLPIWRALAEGVREGDGGAHLMTFHPMGGLSSSQWFHDDGWLDFNMFQSGHGARDIPTYELLEKDYARVPVKPVLDGEPRYENHPINWKPDQGWFDDYDVRQAVYWSVFAGGFGVTYGCHDVWQMKTPEREPVSSARGVWTSSVDLPGAWQMLVLRRLMESRPFLSRVPDQSLIDGAAGSGADHVRATRGDGYAFFYVPTGKPLGVRADAIPAAEVTAWWFDPRTGAATRIGTHPAGEARRFTPPGTPGRGNDWVLVLDDAAKEFGPPGLTK